MTTYLATRHPGAAEWARAQGHGDATIIDHLDTGIVQPGDIVLGTLPVNLAADVCQRGGRYYHLSLLLPQELRGHELSAAEMDSLGAKLVEYVVREANS